MNRPVKRTMVLLAVIGFSCLPGIAVASDARSIGPVIVGDHNQVAGTDIFNAGGDNIVGSGNAGSAGSTIAAALLRDYFSAAGLHQ